MTYQEALRVVESKIPVLVIQNNVEFIWMVVPETDLYFNKYIKDWLTTSKTFFNDTSKRYALDKKFKPFLVRVLKSPY